MAAPMGTRASYAEAGLGSFSGLLVLRPVQDLNIFELWQSLEGLLKSVSVPPLACPLWFRAADLQGPFLISVLAG